ncbi:DinB family protein [Sporosarcina sp. YIM B06819]|uniref:DinB family protein n=1 Tax=Sporosarcina sp. YIM B06819 TaxID=3081769 RepID=UPI00298C2378|nr:DinB family protein [Sporosarcina sp. YIM B06819]
MIGIETLKQLNMARIYTLGRLKKSIEEAWDIQPSGFNNTIRWNAGHILVSMEMLAQKAVGDYVPVHSEWFPFFVTGSSPGGWGENVPANEELLAALKEQPARVMAALEGNLSNVLAEPMAIGPMHTMETAEAVVQFAVWHEGIHAGIIHGLNSVTAE